jgi:hypothetical protein
MNIELNVFGAAMMNWIGRQVNSADIVTIYDSGCVNGTM